MTHVATIVANILTLHFLLISGGIPFSKGIMSSFPSSCSGKRSTNGSKHCYGWIMSKSLVSLIESSFCIWVFLLWHAYMFYPNWFNGLTLIRKRPIPSTTKLCGLDRPVWVLWGPTSMIGIATTSENHVHRILTNKFLKHIYVNKKQVPIWCFKLHLSHFMAFMQPKCVPKTNRLSPDEHRFWHGWCTRSSKWAR